MSLVTESFQFSFCFSIVFNIPASGKHLSSQSLACAALTSSRTGTETSFREGRGLPVQAFMITDRDLDALPTDHEAQKKQATKKSSAAAASRFAAMQAALMLDDDSAGEDDEDEEDETSDEDEVAQEVERPLVEVDSDSEEEETATINAETDSKFDKLSLGITNAAETGVDDCAREPSKEEAARKFRELNGVRVIELCSALGDFEERATEDLPHPSPQEIVHTPVLTFEELKDRRLLASFGRDVSGTVNAQLVDACLAVVGDVAPAGTRPRPTAVQAECWGALLHPPPPDETVYEDGAIGTCMPSSAGPLALSPQVPVGRDLIAISCTGSGKTLAFLLPAVLAVQQAVKFEGDVTSSVSDSLEVLPTGARPDTECRAQKSPGSITRPSALVLAPTRELCQQISAVARAISDVLHRGTPAEGEGAGLRPATGAPQDPLPSRQLSVFCVVGGGDVAPQRERLLAEQPQLIVATVGRLLTLCGELPASTRARQQTPVAQEQASTREEEETQAVCRLCEVRILVLDEADKLLDLGFEEDLTAVLRLIATTSEGSHRSFLDPQVHPRTLMLSATWSPAMQLLARDVLAPGAIHITVGAASQEGRLDPNLEGDGRTVAATVTQRVEVLRGKGAPRVRRLLEILASIASSDVEHGAGERVLVFVVYKKEARDLAKGVLLCVVDSGLWGRFGRLPSNGDGTLLLQVVVHYAKTGLYRGF
ncbi:hypothetical protein CYMTET_12775 [Cymbomonas tetramitiformis]|uniref:Helicase ATP-binding domain-containing protein n=1 Tax=Cymbomonas tetramitiformis TaxID=36881 RepID=A0AAE0LC39_9CHLO|nr:hypothetical protein CYMTET_12775 [Cymbomonas tetramitiformis]